MEGEEEMENTGTRGDLPEEICTLGSLLDHLGCWITFHSYRQNVLLLDEDQESETHTCSRR